MFEFAFYQSAMCCWLLLLVADWGSHHHHGSNKNNWDAVVLGGVGSQSYQNLFGCVAVQICTNVNKDRKLIFVTRQQHSRAAMSKIEKLTFALNKLNFKITFVSAYICVCVCVTWNYNLYIHFVLPIHAGMFQNIREWLHPLLNWNITLKSNIRFEDYLCMGTRSAAARRVLAYTRGVYRNIFSNSIDLSDDGTHPVFVGMWRWWAPCLYLQGWQISKIVYKKRKIRIKM